MGAMGGHLLLFSVQGQLGAAVFRYPESFQILLTRVKDHMMQRLASRSGVKREYISVGLAFNFNKLCGCINSGANDAVSSGCMLFATRGALSILESTFPIDT